MRRSKLALNNALLDYIAKAKLLLLDGADTWKYVKWSPPHSEASQETHSK